MRAQVVALSLLTCVASLAQQPAVTYREFRFGSELRIEAPANWHYTVQKDIPEAQRAAPIVTVEFKMPPYRPGATGHYRLLGAQNATRYVNSTHSLVLVLRESKGSVLSEEELRLATRGDLATLKSIRDRAQASAEMIKSLQQISDVELVFAETILNGTLACERYAIRFNIADDRRETQTTTCPLGERALELSVYTQGPFSPERVSVTEWIARSLQR